MKMYGKILIKAELKVLTGMHIGGSSAFSAIGAVDSPVVIDVRTKMPIIPGSTLKGKMRTLLARSNSKNQQVLPIPNDDVIQIARLFGTSGGSNGILKSKLQFSDSFIVNQSELKEVGFTEVKFENTIDRYNAVANPRQIERVISGTKFDVKVIYDIDKEEEIEEDLKNLVKGMKLLQLDYLGGHGTRGSGRVSFEKIDLVPVECSIDQNTMEAYSKLFKEVEAYELLSI